MYSSRQFIFSVDKYSEMVSYLNTNGYYLEELNQAE